MNFKSSFFGLAAAAMCAGTLVGCDSIKDVRTEPFTDLPAPKGLIAGTISGLGSRRSIVLSWSGAGNQDCQIPDPSNPTDRLPAPCKFLGIQNEESQAFSFGSFDVETPYTINIEVQPYGKSCTVANASGVVGSGGPQPVITCVADTTNFSYYDLTVNLAAAVQSLPNMKVSVETENGTVEQDTNGAASVTFPGVLFNSGSNLPLFQYQVRATYQDTVAGDELPNSCSFTGTATFTSGGTNLDAAGGVVVPTVPASVTVNQCAFTVSAAVVSLDTPSDVGPTGGLELSLRNHYTGEIEQTLSVANFTGQLFGTAPGTTTFQYVNNPVSFPTQIKGNANSLYELIVSQQPTGKRCVVAGMGVVPADTQNATPGINTNINAPTSSVVAALDPGVREWWVYANRQVRCRNIPTTNVLTGTYQMDARTGTQTGNGRIYGRPREFLTFFDDGTFLYGIGMNTASNSSGSPNATFPTTSGSIIRGNYSASSGVIHGFYTYDSVAGTIVFNMLTATNINPAGRGLNGMPGVTSLTVYVSGQGPQFISSSVTASAVTKGVNGDGLGTFSMNFGSGGGLRTWTMTEPAYVPGEISGAWITADHDRVFAYDADFTYVFHMGVNGYGNLQDACMLPVEGSTLSSGRMALHADNAISGNIFVFVPTCTPGLLAFGANYAYSKNYDLPMDLPANTTVPNVIQAFVGPVPPTGLGPTTPRRPVDYHARFPGLERKTNGRPSSPVDFAVTLGTPDTMTVQNTLNGNPIAAEPPIDWVRSQPN